MDFVLVATAQRPLNAMEDLKRLGHMIVIACGHHPVAHYEFYSEKQVSMRILQRVCDVLKGLTICLRNGLLLMSESLSSFNAHAAA